MHLAAQLIALAALILTGLSVVRSRLQWLVVATAVLTELLLSLFYLISDYFTGQGITYAVLAHIRYGVNSGELQISRFPQLIALCVASFAGFAVWLYISLRELKRQRYKTRSVRSWIAWMATLFPLVLIPLHPTLTDLKQLYQQASLHDDQLSHELKWSSDPTLKQEKRSVVYIYMESFERTFLDDRIFPGVSPQLRQLERESLSVHGIVTSPLMNWTIAGMAASQCGMVMAPLPVDSPRGRLDYRPGADCIGDMMKDSGYALSYIGGADLVFSGKGRYYKSHGFDTVVGLNEIKAKAGSSIPYSEWGAYDDTVIALAKQEYIRLKAANTPFGLFMLTTSTHPHSGYASPSCPPDAFDNPMLHAAHCNDQQIYDFVRWLQAQGQEDLVIVVASDHLQVAGDASELLNRSQQRENLFLVLGENIRPRIVQRPSTMLDVAPTLAGILGLGISEMGLGRNLLLVEPTLAERYGTARFNSMIPQWRLGLKESQAMPVNPASHRETHAANH